MDKDLLTTIIVIGIFIVGAVVQFIRGKTIFAIVGAALATFYLVLTLINYYKNRK